MIENFILNGNQDIHYFHDADTKVPNNKVYKYVSLNDDKDMNEMKLNSLRRSEIFLSSFRKMNDPLDGIYLYGQREEISNNGFLERYNKFIHNYRCKHFLACFTSKSESEQPMWAHYSNNHSGYRLEYNVIEPKKLLKVNYINERKDITNKFIDLFKGVKYNFLQMCDIYNPTINHKHEYWSYENEYRVVVFNRNATEVSNGISFTENDFSLQLTKIVVGINCSVNHTNELKKIASERGVQIVRACIDYCSGSYNIIESRKLV